MDKNELMLRAIALSEQSVKHGGGPFGAVIARNGTIISEASNSVTLDNDPTAHAEVNAIRKATAALGTFDLSGCDIYTSCEPCPMCLAACLWANIDKVYYGCTIEDNALIGFRDEQFDELMGGRENLDDCLVELDREACLQLFDEYRALDAQRY